MKACNQNIYNKIQEYLNRCLNTYVEIVVEYKDEIVGSQHQIIQYNRTTNHTWLGVVGNMFDFDFFDCKEVISFVPFCNLTATENTVVTVDEDEDDDTIIVYEEYDPTGHIYDNDEINLNVINERV